MAGIGIPRLVIEQEIDDFHFYTVFAAVISVLFFAVLLVLAQRRWRREYDLRRHSERESAQLHLQQLLEQIDPHFLFNSLNSLYALIRCNPDQAREFTLTLSRVYRRVLERRKQILSTLAEEIDFTWQYYTLQKIRFDDRIELTSAIDPALRNWRIPSMSLQTLVENAVKHNSITGGNPLHIRIRTEGESFLIENNYTPRSDGDKESLGMGLERIRSVYRFYTEENISISVGDGTFRCRLPLLPPVVPAACAAAPAMALMLVPFCWSMMALSFCSCSMACCSWVYRVPFCCTRSRTFSMPSKSIISSTASAASALAGANSPCLLYTSPRPRD